MSANPPSPLDGDRLVALLLESAAYEESFVELYENDVNVDDERRNAADLRALAAALPGLLRDRDLIDAIERGDIQVECMGTTTRYFNAWSEGSDIFTTADGNRSLREVLRDAARVVSQENS